MCMKVYLLINQILNKKKFLLVMEIFNKKISFCEYKLIENELKKIVLEIVDLKSKT